MLFYKAIIINLLLSNFVTSQVVNTSLPSPSPSGPSTVLPTTISSNENKELQKAVKLTHGLSVFIDIFNSTEPIGKNVKALLEASRACGLVLYQGISVNEIKGTQEKTNLENTGDQLDSIIGDLNREITSAELRITYRRSIYFIQKNIIRKSLTLSYSFQRMTYNFYMYNKESVEYFKNTCILNKILSHLSWSDVNQTVVDDNYSDVAYQNLYTIFYNSMKQVIAMLPMCYIIHDGPPNLRVRDLITQDVFDTVKEFSSTFTAVQNERKEKWWSNENIFNIVKRYILGDITFDKPSTSDNKKIAENINGYLAENYRSFGYTYHVGVSNTGTNGNADTLIQCSIDCKYIYGINNKDVYIIRNKQIPVYKECSFVNSTSNVGYKCSGDRDSTDLTELADQIQSECNPTAFSLVRSRLNYQTAGDNQEYLLLTEEKYVSVTKTDTKSPSGFSLKCIGDIYVVMAKTH